MVVGLVEDLLVGQWLVGQWLVGQWLVGQWLVVGCCWSVTVGLDDLAVFKCIRVIFSLEKQTVQFPFSFNHSFHQKGASKL